MEFKLKPIQPISTWPDLKPGTVFRFKEQGPGGCSLAQRTFGMKFLRVVEGIIALNDSFCFVPEEDDHRVAKVVALGYLDL